MGRLSVIVLGSAAGGGFPQWNCACDVCGLAWSGDPRVKPRTQASLAVTAGSPVGIGGQKFVLINASPDLRAQILATPPLQPRDLRNSPIAAVVLTGAEVDQAAGAPGQLLGNRTAECKSEIRPGREEAQEIVLPDYTGYGPACTYHAGRSRPADERRVLADNVAAAVKGKQRLSPYLADAHYLHPAINQNHSVGGGIPLHNERAARGVLTESPEREQILPGAVSQGPKNRPLRPPGRLCPAKQTLLRQN